MKKYVCQCGCGHTKSAKKGDKAPECCGKPMKEMKDGDKQPARSGCGCC